MKQLISYIAPSAPARRRPARGGEPFLRPEVGFTPKWFRDALGIDFGERWHRDPAYRRETLKLMAHELKRRFGDRGIGWIENPDEPMDLLTGVYGACPVAAIYGIPIIYTPDNWPRCAHEYLSPQEIERLEPPDLDSNPFFNELMEQVEWIERELGRVEGYINWQGVLNNAYRLRGEGIFTDMILHPERAKHLFDCVFQTMVEGIKRLHESQRQTGVEVDFCTVSNCLVNMISPKQYEEFLLPFDSKFAEIFGTIGIHNCAWDATPYLPIYATVPNVGYIDMGIETDLALAKKLFPKARRAIMYNPKDLATKSIKEIRDDLERIARECGPCDLVLADIESGTPDERVIEVMELCDEMSVREG